MTASSAPIGARIVRAGETTAHLSEHLQQRHHPAAKAFLARKISEGKTPSEARRALKRHLANVVYRRLHAWAETAPAMNPT